MSVLAGDGWTDVSVDGLRVTMEGRGDRGVVLGFNLDLEICAGGVGRQEMMFRGGFLDWFSDGIIV